MLNCERANCCRVWNDAAASLAAECPDKLESSACWVSIDCFVILPKLTFGAEKISSMRGRAVQRAFRKNTKLRASMLINKGYFLISRAIRSPCIDRALILKDRPKITLFLNLFSSYLPHSCRRRCVLFLLGPVSRPTPDGCLRKGNEKSKRCLPGNLFDAYVYFWRSLLSVYVHQSAAV